MPRKTPQRCRQDMDSPCRYGIRRQSLVLWLFVSLGWQTAVLEGWRFRLPGRRPRNGIDAVNNDMADQVCELDPFVEIVASPTTMPSEAREDYEDLVLAFLKQISQWRLPEPVQDFWRQTKDILLYQPPVGFVAVLVTFRLVYTGRIFTVYGRNTKLSAEGMLQQVESKQKKRRVKPSRALYMDQEDVFYDAYGGVQRIRRGMCWAALQAIATESSTEGQTSGSDAKSAITLAREAMEATHKPGSPRAVFVEEVIVPLSQLEASLTVVDASSGKGKGRTNSNNGTGSPPWAAPTTDVDVLIQMSAKTAELRALDALLRSTRDRLLLTSSRLARTVRHWKNRVRVKRALTRWFQRFVHSKEEAADQLVLSVVQASYDAEVARLGAIQQVLMHRPGEMSDKDLLRLMSKTGDVDMRNSILGKPSKMGDGKGRRRVGFSLPGTSKYSLRWNAEGRGRLSLRVFDEYKTMSTDVAWKALFQNNGDPRQWIEDTLVWTGEARRVLCGVLGESFDMSVADPSPSHKRDMEKIEKWSQYNYTGLSGIDVENHWTTVLAHVELVDEQRRLGEGRTVRLDAGISLWTDRIDVYGIPSSLATIGLAQIVHNRLLPYWPTFKKGALETAEVVWTIVEKRFWKPFYGILVGLISRKDSSLLDAFDVENEETSLDNMLRDLGLGDGTPDTRKTAIQGAARAYENDMDSGVLRSALRGRLVRLLLVQVQQLKAGLLHALASIDVLVDANKLNLQILTAIPSVLIVAFCTRIFIRTLFTVRSKDLRSLEDVHAEMSEYLNEMEKSLIMADTPSYVLSTSQDMNRNSNSTRPLLHPKELGQYLLHMHSYLVLLDYCSPPFPFRMCESIQTCLQDLLSMQGSSGTDPQVAMVHLLRQQHNELQKYM